MEMFSFSFRCHLLNSQRQRCAALTLIFWRKITEFFYVQPNSFRLTNESNSLSHWLLEFFEFTIVSSGMNVFDGRMCPLKMKILACQPSI